MKRIDADIAELEHQIWQETARRRLGKISLRDWIKVVDVSSLKDRMTELQTLKDHINEVEKLTTFQEGICKRSRGIDAAG